MEDTHLAALELEEMSEDQRSQLAEMVTNEICDTANRPLGYTD